LICGAVVLAAALILRSIFNESVSRTTLKSK
jgi:hypothetical protein